MTRRAVLLGATGFVGAACADAARRRGLELVTVAAPRLETRAADPVALDREVTRHADVVASLAEDLGSADVVINAAGLALPGAVDSASLRGANALLPAVLQHAVREAGGARLVHVSSAAVQGFADRLDETWGHRPFSAYSASKALGESYLRATGDPSTIVYRATSVHGVERATTRSLARFAASRWSSVAGRGAAPSPQVLVENLADAVLHVATSETQPPSVVLHPWEGLSCHDVLLLLSGAPPHHLPTSVARGAVRVARTCGRPGVSRRLEMVWFGQGQLETWLDRVRWTPPSGRSAWRDLGAALRTRRRAGGGAA